MLQYYWALSLLCRGLKTWVFLVGGVRFGSRFDFRVKKIILSSVSALSSFTKNYLGIGFGGSILSFKRAAVRVFDSVLSLVLYFLPFPAASRVYHNSSVYRNWSRIFCVICAWRTSLNRLIFQFWVYNSHYIGNW